MINQAEKIAIIGNGPAGLMAAYQLSHAGYHVDLYDKNSGVGRKLLIAGSSGLNIGNNESIENFSSIIKIDKAHYENFFTPQWLNFINIQLQTRTFLGTSGRYFIEDMHSAKFVQNWIQLLELLEVKIFKNSQLINFDIASDKKITLTFNSNGKSYSTDPYDAVGFYLGGGSWETKAVEWPALFKNKGYAFEEFHPQNVGFYLKNLNASFFEEAKYQPIKDCILKTALGEKRGDVLVTNYGLEGTPIYHVGITGQATLDLFPDKSSDELLAVINKIGEKENLKMVRRMNRLPGLTPPSKALIFHSLKDKGEVSAQDMSKLLKNFPIILGEERPLAEAMSTSGGINFSNLDSNLMSKIHPGVFFGGEMLNWNAPTGGYLIQTCITQGHISAQAMIEYFRKR